MTKRKKLALCILSFIVVICAIIASGVVIIKINKKLNNNNIRLESVKNTQKEILWSEIYNNTISSSNWLSNKSISPGRWALGYPALYALYQTLDNQQPSSILELGMGESTKVITQWAKYKQNCKHYVVEHDAKWISTFSKNNELAEQTEIVNLSLNTNDSFLGCSNIISYDKFAESFAGKKFDFIVIDGPFGSKGDYSRIDVLTILPDCLNESFVIMMDDYERNGEKNTINLIKDTLNDNNIDFFTGQYDGEKKAYMITSPDLKFLCSK